MVTQRIGRLGNHVSRVKALSFGGTVASIQGKRRKAMRYFAQAMEMADELSDPIHWVRLLIESGNSA